MLTRCGELCSQIKFVVPRVFSEIRSCKGQMKEASEKYSYFVRIFFHITEACTRVS